MSLTIFIIISVSLCTCTINDISSDRGSTNRTHCRSTSVSHYRHSDIGFCGHIFTIHVGIRRYRGDCKATISVDHYTLRNSIRIITLISYGISPYYYCATGNNFFEIIRID